MRRPLLTPLLVSLAAVVATGIVILATPVYLRLPAALALGTLLPGLGLHMVVWPSRPALGWVERLIHGLALSVLLTTGVSLGLGYLGEWGAVNLAWSLGGLATAAGLLATLFRTIPTVARSYLSPVTSAHHPAGASRSQWTFPLVVLLILVGLAAVVAVGWVASLDPVVEEFTEMTLTGPDGRVESLPRVLPANASADLRIEVGSRTSSPRSFDLVRQVHNGTALVDDRAITTFQLEPGEDRRFPDTLRFNAPGVYVVSYQLRARDTGADLEVHLIITVI